MKHITIFALIVVLLCSFTYTSEASRESTCNINNFQRVGNIYTFVVNVQNTGTIDFDVKNSQFKFHYNASALSNPVLTYMNPRYSTNVYKPMAVTISGDTLKINIIKQGSPLPLLYINDSLCVVSMTITNPSAIADLFPVYWSTNNAFNFNTGNVTTNFVGADFGVLPIQLSSFTGNYIATNNSVHLAWQTISEIENYGFNIERRLVNTTVWDVLGFVPGNPQQPTLEAHDYSFDDLTITSGQIYQYRLNQIDMDGSSHPTDPIQVSILTTDVSNSQVVSEFKLEQNYPNPFNPTTNITFSVVKNGYVSLKVFDVLGQEIATLVDGNFENGSHSVIWNATNVTTGTYFAKITVNGSTSLIKMNLVK